MWALEWLWDSLGIRLESFAKEISQEIENTPGGQTHLFYFELFGVYFSARF